MNENTTKLIQQLAEKLGTTSQYLWSVLLKQAQIDATINVIEFLLCLLFGAAIFKIHKMFMKKSVYEKYEEGAAVPMALATLVFFMMLIICLFDIDNIVNGYFNPEYWALNEILHRIN